ncbi:MAG: T9SS type A sorting domain-containing protein [Bacteroidota bacterium]
MSDDDCGDLPNIILDKEFVSAEVQADGSYDVTYTIAVSNNGGAAGEYNLTDTPTFDDDVTINAGSYSGEASGALNTSGSTTLTEDNSIAAGITETFTLVFNVTLDLSGGVNDPGGDNIYDACEGGMTEGITGTPGTGLYNRADLDTNDDGQPDVSDDDCGDLPAYELDKEFVSAIVQPDGSYDVTYTIAVSNVGGAAGEYNLTDTPTFDDDVTINAGSYAGEASGALNTSGSTTLTEDNAIAAGATETFTLVYNVTLDLTGTINDGGDDVYTACEGGSAEGITGTPGTGLYNRADLDTNDDGQPDLSDDDCGDLPAYELDKEFVSAIVQPDGTYDVTYTIAVSNVGGAAGEYNLTDTPTFEDDVTINAGSYSGEASGALNTSGSTTLTEDNAIAAGATETFTLVYNVTLDLTGTINDGGDDVYTACDGGSAEGITGTPGTGLYNRADLDTNDDGQPDLSDDDCGDLPNIILDKEFVSAEVQADGSYDVTYTIAVSNNGGAAGEYNLTDTPEFDDDVTINAGSYSGEASGALNTSGSTTLTEDNPIAAGGTETFTLVFNVTLDLSGGVNDPGGDNIYDACEGGMTEGITGTPGTGLYNRADLDTNDDGQPDVSDDDCGDLPAYELDKEFVSAEVQPDGSYDVTYTIAVSNVGGAAGEYNLTDTPTFDDDVTINAGSYSGEASGALNTSGSTTLTEDNAIAAGATETFTLVYNVTLDLTGTINDGGDDVYTVCEGGSGEGITGTPGTGLYNRADLDTNDDGQPDLSDDDCGDLPAYELDKEFVSATIQPDGTYDVTYTIAVSNVGGAAGEYNLTDTPTFEDDVTINSGSYSGEASGALNTSGSTTLTEDNPIAAGATETFTLVFNVTLDLTGTINDGGDDVYTACEGGSAEGITGTPGTGLYNRADLDTNDDGQPDLSDDDCGDLPAYELDKEFVSAIVQPDGTYDVTYTIAVSNIGGAAGEYNLTDTPTFEDDVTINAGSYAGEASGALNTSGSTTLTEDNAIAAGATETFTLVYNVTLDLTGTINDGGDDVYTACEGGSAEGITGTPGTGLYNRADLDVNDDGQPDLSDDDCGDLPNIILDKEFISADVQPDGSYDVTYTIAVSNNGGAAGEYNLTDTPSFDDDVTINAGSYSGEASGALNTSGSTTLTEDNPIAAGATETFTLVYNVTLDLTGTINDGGDDVYTVCEGGSGEGITGTPGTGLYNRADLDTNDDGQPDVSDDDCGDLPAYELDKEFVSAIVQPDGTYDVTYTIAVSNVGGAAGEYNLTDTPSFEDDVTINSGSYAGEASGALNTSGSTTLTEDNAIDAGITETFTLVYNVTLDLTGTLNDGGDDVYTVCEGGSGEGITGTPGTGLYNRADLDTNDDGQPDLSDDDCGDLPNITLDKEFVSAEVQPDGSYNVTYTIAVTNDGGATGEYNLTDTPEFDDDVTINAGSYSGEASGALNTSGSTTLTEDNPIAAGATETFTLVFNVTLDLSGDVNDPGGDNIYDACEGGMTEGITGTPGTGLYNRADLDTNDDGQPDVSDDDCGDLPAYELDKEFVSAVQVDDNTYNVTYTVAVSNVGGAAGEYNLTDTPTFDDDVTINAGSYSGEASGALNTSGSTTLTEDNAIAVGATETFTLVYNVTLDLSGTIDDGGDDVYTECEGGSGEGITGTPGTGLYNRADLDVNDDGQPDLSDDDCGDLPYLELDKAFVSATNNDDGTTTVVYTIEVSNTGGADASYDLMDTPDFDSDVIIESGTYSGPVSGDLNTSGSTTLATGITLGAGETDTYTLTFIVSLSLTDGIGDEVYTECQEDQNGTLFPGTGLFNEANLNIDGDDFFEVADTTCGDLELPCELTLTIIGGPDCDDNGTPTNPDDDFFTVTYIVEASNASTGWINNFGESGDYGVPFTSTFPVVFTPNPADIVIRVTDVNNPNCEDFDLITPTGPCSDQCAIEAAVTASPVCNDASTPVFPEDDFLVVGVTVSEVNAAGSGWAAILPNGTQLGTGSYGSEVMINIQQDQIPDNDEIVLFIVDNNDPACRDTLEFEVPDDFPCSDQCLIEAELILVECYDWETEAEPADDGFFALITITGENSVGWSSPEFGYTGFNAFGTYLFGPFQGVNAVVEIPFFAWDAPAFCQASVTAEGPGFPCSNDCEIEASFGVPFCFDNDTPADSTDDVFFIDITAFTVGQNNGNSWILFVDGEEVVDEQPFNTTGTYGPFAILDEDGNRASYDFRVRDVSSLYCRVDSTIMAPATCSDGTPVCDLDVEVLEVVCNPSDTDNGYFISINVTNGDQGGTYTLTGGGLTEPVVGTYGVVLDLPELEDADGELLTFTVSDNSQSNCSTSFQVEEPLGCITCELMADVFDRTCYDNGTPFDDSDDTYTAWAVFTGANGQFTAVFNSPEGLAPITGNFGDTITIGPISVNSDANITVTADENDNCSVTVLLQSTGPCSGDCVIIAVLDSEGITCDNGGTPEDPTDDTFGGTVIVSGNGTSPAGFMYDDGRGNTGFGTYGEPLTFDGYLNADGDVTITFLDLVSENCTTSIVLEAPADNCGDCFINVSLIDKSDCNQNGTPTDGSDDFFTVIVNVTGGGTGSGWTSAFGGGAYGEDVTLTLPIGDGTDFELLISDVDNPNCNDAIMVINPGPCVEVCMINATVVAEGPCDQNGTPADGSDDFFTVVVNVTGSGTGAGWTSGFGGGAYGEDVTLTLPIGEGGDYEILITDLDDPNCNDAIFVQNPGPCVNDCTIEASVTAVGPCEDNGTSNNSADDTFEVTVLVTGTDTGAGWTSIYGGGDYGVPTVLTLPTGQVEGATIEIVISDDTFSGCGTTVNVTSPGDCSDDDPQIECPISNHFCPIIEENIMLFPMDLYDCVATFEVPLPIINDPCPEGFTITTLVIDENGDVVAEFADGDDREIVLGGGDYIVRYILADNCGNEGITQDCIIRVADLQEPEAFCIGHLDASVGGFGIARVFPWRLDFGSADNCSIDTFEVRRLIEIDPITGDSLDVPFWTEWVEYFDLTCEDVGYVVTAQLRVVDGSGNANVCTTLINVIDNTLPYCTGLEDLTISCDSLPADFDPTDTLHLQEVFGLVEVVDNCSAIATELTPYYVGDECGLSGVITRRFVALDQAGNASLFEFNQVITIIGDESFDIAFPADTVTECLDIDQGLVITGASCVDLNVSFVDEVVPAQDGEEGCLVVERTYTVHNNCAPLTADSVIIGRDEDCDGVEGEAITYALVNGSLTYVDLDADFTNSFPAAGSTDCIGGNPEGHIRSIENIGTWIYTQRIILQDDTQPVLIFDAPDPICIDSEETCLTMTTINVHIDDECTGAGGQFIVLVDLESDGSSDMLLNRDDHFSGEFPDFTIEVELPVGNHTYMVRYIDGCDNSSSASIPVEVYDCSIPLPTCYSGLILDLEELTQPVDIDGDGILDGAAVFADANVLASCAITDCSGELTFSVNRVGDTPDRTNNLVGLTCNDRYTVELEVYMWDNAFNPTAVQPDGSVGGPNWEMCLVEVSVQDPDELCPDCSGEGQLTIAGEIRTSAGVSVENVEVNLTGSMNTLQLTDEGGNYRFEGMEGGDYVLQPYKNDNPTNGLSTLDALILHRHLLGVEMITDPYVWMAADANGDGSLSTLDLLMIRGIILGTFEEFVGNTSWRFFDASAVMTMPEEGGMPVGVAESIVIENIVDCAFDHNFMAVKIGDLDKSAVANSQLGAQSGTEGRTDLESHPLRMEDQWLKAGETYRLPVRSADLERLSGFQFTLAANSDVQLLAAEPALLGAEHLGQSRLDRNLVSISWNQAAEQVSGDAILFYLELTTNRSTSVNELFRLVDLPTQVEAYDLDREALPLHLHFVTQPILVTQTEELGESFELLQNFPNPFSTNTNIRFYLPQAGEAQLELRDAAGRVVRTYNQAYPAGYNLIQVEGRDLAAGLYYYSLRANGEIRNRTMVKMR